MTIIETQMALCAEINKQWRELTYSFEQHSVEQTLKIANTPPVNFDPEAGGSVLGGSGKWIADKHWKSKIHEPGTIAALLGLREFYAQQITRIFDIGALYGYFSLISLASFRQAQVSTFEMHPHSFQALRRNMLRNRHLDVDRMTPIHAGLSDTTRLQAPVEISDFSLKETPGGEDRVTDRIDILALDDFVRLTGTEPDLMKIDVEGYQEKIFAGAKRTLRTVRPIVLMELDERMVGSDSTNRDVIARFFPQGYACLLSEDHRGPGGSFEPVAIEEIPSDVNQGMVVLLPENRPPSLR